MRQAPQLLLSLRAANGIRRKGAERVRTLKVKVKERRRAKTKPRAGPAMAAATAEAAGTVKVAAANPAAVKPRLLLRGR